MIPEIDSLTARLQGLSITAGNAIAAARKSGPIDTTIAFFFRLLNAVSATIYAPVIDPSRCKTYSQEKREVELAKMKEQFSPDSPYHPFCRVTAKFVEEASQEIFAENLALLPRKVEDWAHFKICLTFPYYSGYAIEYLLRQVERRRDVRGELIESDVGKALQRFYGRLRTKVADSLLNAAVVEPFVSVEHAIWKGCLKMHAFENKERDYRKLPPLFCSTLHALAPIILAQANIIEVLKKETQSRQLTREEALIWWISALKRKNLLPPSLPDPHNVGLTTANLQTQLDMALHSYLRGTVQTLLDRHVALDGLFSRLLYQLEGKEFITETATSFLVKFGLEQILDPDKLAILLLSAARVDTVEIEQEAFGPKSKPVIWQCGQKMLKQSLEERLSASNIVKTFHDSPLRASPASRKAIVMRIETQKKLKQVIVGLLRKLFEKREKSPLNSSGLFSTEGLRKAIGELPFIGPVTKGLHLTLNAAYLSGQYFFSDAEEGFGIWLTKQLSGDPLFEHLADKFIELLYHPSWRILVLQAVDALIQSEVYEKKEPNAEKDVYKNFQTIATFLFSHFAPETVKTSVGSWATYFTGEKAFHKVKEALTQPPKESLMETKLPLVQSLVEEYLVYVRLTQSMRALGVEFEGDAKLWECYVREYLNKKVASDPKNENAREDAIKELVNFDAAALREVLSKDPKPNPQSTYLK